MSGAPGFHGKKPAPKGGAGLKTNRADGTPPFYERFLRRSAAPPSRIAPASAADEAGSGTAATETARIMASLAKLAPNVAKVATLGAWAGLRGGASSESDPAACATGRVASDGDLAFGKLLVTHVKHFPGVEGDAAYEAIGHGRAAQHVGQKTGLAVDPDGVVEHAVVVRIGIHKQIGQLLRTRD